MERKEEGVDEPKNQYTGLRTFARSFGCLQFCGFFDFLIFFFFVFNFNFKL